jgi:hypothetical protein
MDHYRIQDSVARLSRVNLQSTVSVLNALYVVSKTLEKEGELGLRSLRMQLEGVLLAGTMNSEGDLRGLRARPDRGDVKGCLKVCDMVQENCLSDMRLIQRGASVELFTKLFGSMSQSHASVAY